MEFQCRRPGKNFATTFLFSLKHECCKLMIDVIDFLAMVWEEVREGGEVLYALEEVMVEAKFA